MSPSHKILVAETYGWGSSWEAVLRALLRLDRWTKLALGDGFETGADDRDDLLTRCRGKALVFKLPDRSHREFARRIWRWMVQVMAMTDDADWTAEVRWREKVSMKDRQRETAGG